MAFDMEKFNLLISKSEFDFKFLYFDSIGSTNDYAKTHTLDDESKTTVIISSSQTNGRGRIRREFISEKDKGIYFSIVKHGLKNCQIDMLTVAAAVCVCEAIEEECDVRLSIKWVNDILLDDKKICGILTENVFDNKTKNIDLSIIGIGINLFGKVDEKIQNIASSIEALTNKKISAENVVFNTVCGLERFFLNQNKEDVINKYRERCITVGRDVLVNDFTTTYQAKAIEVDDDGSLVVEFNEKKLHINSGEVSVLPLKSK